MNTRSRMTDRIIKINYLDYVPPSRGEGRIGEIYRLAEKEFGAAAEPIVVHSVAPSLLDRFWELGRETLLVSSQVPRLHKEAITTAISVINRCPYCVDVHGVLSNALGDASLAKAIERNDFDAIGDENLRRRVHWASQTRTPGSAIIQSPPFSLSEAPEIVGTAIYFHYVNRLVNVFVQESHLPTSRWRGVFHRLGTWMMTSILRQSIAAGAERAYRVSPRALAGLDWAQAEPRIANRFAAFGQETNRLAREHLSADVRHRVQTYLQNWQGEDPGLGRAWLEEIVADLDAPDAIQVRLALVSAITPYRIDDALIGSFREIHPQDEALLAIVAWSSFATALRIGQWLGASLRSPQDVPGRKLETA